MNMFVNNVKSSRHYWNDPGMVLQCKFEVRNVVIEQLMMMPTERSCLQHFWKLLCIIVYDICCPQSMKNVIV